MIDEKLKTARILILGGAGFLGARIVRKLCIAGIKPHLLIRSKSRLDRINDLVQSVEIHIGDLTEKISLQAVIDDIQPNIIFYTAGHGSYKGQNERDAIFMSNLLATHNLLLATESVPDCRIIYSGSSLEKGMLNKPIEETDRPNPVSFYAATKSAAVTLVRQAARHENRPIIILYPFAMYGIGEPLERLIPTAIRAGIEGKTLALTQSGFVRDYIHVDDVADAYLLAATNNRVIGESINIAGGKPTSNEAVVKKIEALLGHSINKQVGAYTPRMTDTNYWCANIDKAHKLLEWEPAYSLEQGLKFTINWYKKHGFNF